MYNPPVCNEYIPFEYPELNEYIPEPTQEHNGFQWNPVSSNPELHPFQGDAYDIPLAQAAFQAGLSYKDLLEAA